MGGATSQQSINEASSAVNAQVNCMQQMSTSLSSTTISTNSLNISNATGSNISNVSQSITDNINFSVLSTSSNNMQLQQQLSSALNQSLNASGTAAGKTSVKSATINNITTCVGVNYNQEQMQEASATVSSMNAIVMQGLTNTDVNNISQNISVTMAQEIAQQTVGQIAMASGATNQTVQSSINSKSSSVTAATGAFFTGFTSLLTGGLMWVFFIILAICALVWVFGDAAKKNPELVDAGLMIATDGAYAAVK